MKTTIKELLTICENINYNNKHGLTAADVDKVNGLINLIESKSKAPKNGDYIEISDDHGSFYKCARVDGFGFDDNGGEDLQRVRYCERAYTPFIWSDGGDYKTSISGGSFAGIARADIKHIGRKATLFCAWGHAGPCAGGAVHFYAMANAWEWKSKTPFFGDYTTEKYNKVYISDCPRPEERYRFLGDGIAFETQKELDCFLSTFRAVGFDWPHSSNRQVYFLYTTDKKMISFDDWQKLELPIDTRTCNGIINVKVSYDDKTATITEYRHTNDGGNAKRNAKPYALARA
jgi:hypothetical protein